jgi:restriction endonuclease S subunit
MKFDLILLSGTPASGKDTLTKELCTIDKRFVHFKKHKIASGGKLDDTYYLVTKKEFDQMVENGEFLQYHYRYERGYGVSYKELFFLKEQGKIPVISQSSNNIISGYVDNAEPITDLPLIIFGDHTCSLKYVDFPFVRGADGVQLLKPKKDVLPKYLYYILQNLNIPDKDQYKRHFKILKSIKIPLPPLEIQKELVEKIEKLEEKINSLKEKNKQIQKEIKKILKETLE